MTGLREISVMAWIENEFGQVLMVRQAQGSKQWTLPGGKLRAGEELMAGLRREIREETGLAIASSRLIAVYDRVTRKCLVVLFRVVLKKGTPSVNRPNEIAQIDFKSRVPAKATPSAKYFWTNRERLSL